MTEAADQFAQPVTSGQNNDNKELKNYLKGHHFDFGIKGSRTTAHKNQPYLRADGPKSGLAFDRSN